MTRCSPGHGIRTPRLWSTCRSQSQTSDSERLIPQHAVQGAYTLIAMLHLKCAGVEKGWWTDVHVIAPTCRVQLCVVGLSHVPRTCRQHATSPQIFSESIVASNSLYLGQDILSGQSHAILAYVQGEGGAPHILSLTSSSTNSVNALQCLLLEQCSR